MLLFQTLGNRSVLPVKTLENPSLAESRGTTVVVHSTTTSRWRRGACWRASGTTIPRGTSPGRARSCSCKASWCRDASVPLRKGKVRTLSQETTHHGDKKNMVPLNICKQKHKHAKMCRLFSWQGRHMQRTAHLVLLLTQTNQQSTSPKTAPHPTQPKPPPAPAPAPTR